MMTMERWRIMKLFVKKITSFVIITSMLTAIPLTSNVYSNTTEANLIVQYDFAYNLTDSLGNSTLTTFGATNDGTNRNNATTGFGRDDYGTYWTWTSTTARGGGFWIDIDRDISDNYAVGVRFSLNETGPSWKKIIDYKNSASDNGFYFYQGGKLQFYPYSPLGISTIGNSEIVDVIATRSAAGQFVAYYVINGVAVKELEVADGSKHAVPSVVEGKTRLGFFFDDTRTASEAATGGRVYSIKIWDQPITEVQVDKALNITEKESGDPFDAGVRLEWKASSELGYRLFRSTSPGVLGLSVTDFYIENRTFMDVNVLPNTRYYYTVKPVLAEARPIEGIEELLGEAIATFIVDTSDTIANIGKTKQFISLTIDNPFMQVNGVREEIDPGIGTTPVIMNARTVVPIRAIVEAMGGAISWDSNERKVTIQARGNKIEMWIDKTDLRVNGVLAAMDVAPVIRNGRTFVPLRFASENLDTRVSWINSTREVVIVYTE